MRPKKLAHILDETGFHLDQSLQTGILQWQELAHLQFRDLMKLVYARNVLPEEMGDNRLSFPKCADF